MALKRSGKPGARSLPPVSNPDSKISRLLFRVCETVGISPEKIFFYSVYADSMKAISLFLFILFESQSAISFIKNVFSYYNLKFTKNEISSFFCQGYFFAKSNEDFNKLVNDTVNELSNFEYLLSKNLDMENTHEGIITEVIRDFPDSNPEELRSYLLRNFNIEIDADAIALRLERKNEH